MILAVEILKYVQPLVPLILGIALLFLLIKESLIQKKILKFRLTITFLIVLVCALLLAFYSEFDEEIRTVDWILVGLDAGIGLLFILFSGISSSKEQFNQDLFLTLDQTKYYVLVDKKNRIREISSLFLKDLELTEAEVYKKNLFKTIEKRYQIFKMNGTSMTLEDIHIYFSSSDTKDSTLNLEIHDEHGDVHAYYFAQRPLMMLGKFSGRIFIGDKKSSEQLVGMEKNLKESSSELEMIKNRFMTILERTTEGIFFTDLTHQRIWINDVLVKKLRLNYNDMSLDEFMQNIHPDDLAMYNEKRSLINNIHPKYAMSYRFNIGSSYVFLKEEGARITNGKTIELCGVMHLLEGKKLTKTETELDQVLGEPEMLSMVDSLYKQEQTFQFVLLKLVSIDKANEEHGRSFGDMILSEYIKYFANRYVDAKMVYRVSGLEFVAVLTDYHKIEKLKRDLMNNEKILHMNVDYGTMKTQIEAVMGICYSTDAKNAKDILKKSKDILHICSKEQYSKNYAYYKDIH